ncbi:DUF547 domain-containing protein [Winogradskyella pulchriflava]|uniref:DUF547 domain-containing protein n=1 Tax=Winogradskyella pulchriflava TaxID=1110688 RepID=A0ABV6Q437_9FLAO
MKYSFVLFLILFISSCCGTKKTVESQPESTKEIAIVTEVPDVIDIKHDIDSEIEVWIEIEETPIEPKENDIVEDIEIEETLNHKNWDNLLLKYVYKGGRVDYLAFKRNRNKLLEYIESLKKNLPTDDWSKKEKLAYWINAYNALTIDLILRNYPKKSIKDIKDPWDQRLWQFDDKWLNLNDIEHKILRKMDEPRIHFAIVCASVSCPKLQNEAFTASNLEEQLTNATKEFLADKSKNEISQNNLKLSKIFKWFKKDFEQDGSLIDFLNQYSTVIISDSAKKSYKDYNWDLNE